MLILAYVRLINANMKTIDDVPEKYKAMVSEMINCQGQ
jgi:hypothetical protein